MKTQPLVFSKKRDVSQQHLNSQLESIGRSTPAKRDVSVPPSQTEIIRQPSDVSYLFNELHHINVILTNACNLSCSYCYEQHTSDYGRLDNDKLIKLYHFLRDINDHPDKIYQFFGGEPLIHKKIILDFLDKYADELTENQLKLRVGITTNGILLDDEFVESYFKHPFVDINISLDTDQLEFDHRELTQSQLDHIFKMIKKIPFSHKESGNVDIRCTISPETAPRMVSFITYLYEELDMRSMIIHPLTMSSADGFVEWTDADWKKLQDDIEMLSAKFPDFQLQFSEGVGAKRGGNCMVGSSMIVVDGSGDYSGCYFFTNRKAEVPHTILGNLLQDKVYVERYTAFNSEYQKMFDTYDQCKSCDLKSLCYQCPAGNLVTGDGTMFRPDAMCQRIVTLFLDLLNDRTKYQFITKFKNIVAAAGDKGVEFTMNKALIHLMYRQYTHHHVMPIDVETAIHNHMPTTSQIIKTFVDMIDGQVHLPENVHTVTEFISEYCNVVNDNLSEYTIGLLVERVHRLHNIPMSQSIESDDDTKNLFMLTLLHFLLLNDTGYEMMQAGEAAARYDNE